MKHMINYLEQHDAMIGLTHLCDYVDAQEKIAYRISNKIHSKTSDEVYDKK